MRFFPVARMFEMHRKWTSAFKQTSRFNSSVLEAKYGISALYKVQLQDVKIRVRN